ncbi:hypothetical protein [Streptomyces sp. bgisy082]|uniref:hypothetical protein n=1 Tax=Streptomyces sp. bgisy082 TaxID=3413776 RepID=UPI003D707E10
MGRHKLHKPRAPRGKDGQPTEWFGTAFHSVRGMQHLDVRRSGNGILITSSPAEIDGAPASWQLRLRNDDGSQGLNEMGTAMKAGQRGARCQDRPGVPPEPPRRGRRHAGPGPFRRRSGR